ncbi:hypothetical protein [Mesorhizobium sp. B2-3-6]|uniref:hypothetical protein n=1 Tax=Mesorhizobium sp. B2-3-6 TaxID=2589957 RepID=UPI00112D880A|nr:hypothetical protein [Mesorhizobium sp. B2-3-6]TPM14012.1 hypothetical protein FJ953_26820 [Mesorhizobium sp. B2-3-6]
MTSIQIDLKDGLSSSTAIKGPVKVATTGNITLSGQQTIDGVAVVTGDRVLVKDQTAASENGIWIADTGPWRRSKDFNKTRDVVTGTQILITSGDLYASSGWYLSTSDPISIGSTNLVFTQNILLDAAQLIALEASAAAAAAAASGSSSAAATSAASAAASAASINLPAVVADTMLVAKPDASGYLLKAKADVRDFLDTPVYVADRTAAKALDPAKDKAFIIHAEGGRNGSFVYTLTSSLSTAEAAAATADTSEGIYFTNGLYTAVRQGDWHQGADARLFGALGGGVTNNDTVPLLAAPAFVGRGGRTIVWPKDSHYLNDVLVVPEGGSLVGQTGPWKGYAGNRFDFYNQGSTIVMGPSGKIKLSAGSTVKDLVIIKEGIVNTVTQAQAAAWTGTAIQGDTDNWSVLGCSIFGFQYGINSAGGQRMLIDGVQGDCSNGIYISGNFDVGQINGCHFWPFLSAYSEPGTPVTANRLRAGNGLTLKDVSDWTKVTNNFFYGYMNGYLIDNVQSVSMVNNSADSSFNDIRAGSAGVSVINGTSNLRIIGQQAAAHATGINIATGGATNFVLVDGPSVWANNTAGIVCGLGDVAVTGARVRNNTLHTTAAGIRLTDGAGLCRLSDITFNDYSGANNIAIDIASSIQRGSLTIQDETIRFINCGTSPIRGAGSFGTEPLASAANISLPGYGDYFVITGVTSIGNFVNNSWEGRRLELLFSAALTLVHSGSLILQGSVNAVVTTNTVMRFVRRGSAWIETGRSIK